MLSLGNETNGSNGLLMANLFWGTATVRVHKDEIKIRVAEGSANVS